MSVTLALLALLSALVLLVLSQMLQRAIGAAGGPVVYDDTGALQRNTRALYSPRYRLSGKPDFLLRTEDAVIPMELKATAARSQPYRGHRLQLAAYCLLVEETWGKAPPYGIIRYTDREFRLPYDAQLKAELLHTLEEMRAALKGAGASRNHDERGRCMRCAVRDACDERLAD